MSDTIIYRHWQSGDDDAVLAFLPNTNENWYRHKFDETEDNTLEPEGIRLAFVGKKVVGHALGESTSLFFEEKVQKFGTVSAVFVAPDMRQRGIATELMRGMHAYFEKKDYRGSILETDNDAARKLYLKTGYRQITRVLRTEIRPNQYVSQLRWTDTDTEDLSVLHQLDRNWARQNFPVWWTPEIPGVNNGNRNDYRVLRRGKHIIGYAEWSEPSKFFPQGRICDPIVPNESPIEVIKSVQAAILTPLVWETCAGSRYEKLLRSLECSLNPASNFTMLLSFGSKIDLTKHYRSL